MKYHNNIFILLLLSTHSAPKAQDTIGLKLVRYDTLELNFKSSKVLEYKKSNATILLDYTEARQLLISLAEQGPLKELAKQQLNNVEIQITKNDTAWLDDSVFVKWKWAPFRQFICNALASKRCLIRDNSGKLHTKLIRIHGFIWPDKYIQWSGWRFFVPGHLDYFFECTETES